MTRPFDFNLLPRSKDTAKRYYQFQLEQIQSFSIDSGVSFDQVLKMPHWLMHDYYDCGAWNIKKPHIEKDDQIVMSVLQLLKNVITLLK